MAPDTLAEEVITPEIETVAEKTIADEVRKVEKAEESEYVTINFSKAGLPIAMVVSSLIIAVGLGLGIYFGLKAQAPAAVSTITPTGTVTTNGTGLEATAFPEVTAKIGTGIVKGEKSSKVVIVEFNDYMCVFCRQFATGISVQTGTKSGPSAQSQVIEEYVNKGKAYLVTRNFPLSQHEPAATKMAIIAECVNRDYGAQTYYKFHDEAFSRFEQIQTQSSAGIDTIQTQIDALLTAIGTDKNKVMKCANAKETQQIIVNDNADVTLIDSQVFTAIGKHVGTPLFVVGVVQSDGTVKGRAINGAYPFEAFKNVIEEQLTK